MNVEFQIPGLAPQAPYFITWRPVELKLALKNAAAGPAAVSVRLSSTTKPAGGRVDFANGPSATRSPSKTINLPRDGQPVSVWIGGAFPAASSSYGDVAVEARTSAGELIGSRPLMVRIRKDANALTSVERDRFLVALATLNGAGAGPFAQIREMHRSLQSLNAAHGAPGFLAWHRAYILDLERQLQAIDAQVTLPYWRFDRPAPKVFSRSFIGISAANSRVGFAAGHPFLTWATDGVAGIERGNVVGPSTVLPLRTEAQTLALGRGPPISFAQFAAMERNPHNGAHSGHNAGFIIDPSTAPRDPLFFLVHCNVDRLWARWQFLHNLHDPADARSFDPASTRLGHRLNDPMWPWSTAGAPGGPLAPSPMTPAPGPSPRIRDLIDYLGKISGPGLDFAYDDVPF